MTSCFNCASVLESCLPSSAPRCPQVDALNDQIKKVVGIYKKIAEQDRQLKGVKPFKAAQIISKDPLLGARLRQATQKLTQLLEQTGRVDGLPATTDLDTLQNARKRAVTALGLQTMHLQGLAQKEKLKNSVDEICEKSKKVWIVFESVESCLRKVNYQLADEKYTLVGASNALLLYDELRKKIQKVVTVALPSQQEFERLFNVIERRFEIIDGLKGNPRAQELFQKRDVFESDLKDLRRAFERVKLAIRGRTYHVTNLRKTQGLLQDLLEKYERLDNDVRYFTEMKRNLDEDVEQIQTMLGNIDESLNSEAAWQAELDKDRRIFDDLVRDTFGEKSLVRDHLKRVGYRGGQEQFEGILRNYRAMKKEIRKYPALQNQWKKDKEDCKAVLAEIRAVRSPKLAALAALFSCKEASHGN